MSNTEKATRKRVRKNYQSKIQDLILYCKVSIEVLDGRRVAAGNTSIDEAEEGKIIAFKAVLNRLGVEL